jgi:hypothetical protein
VGLRVSKKVRSPPVRSEVKSALLPALPFSLCFLDMKKKKSSCSASPRGSRSEKNSTRQHCVSVHQPDAGTLKTTFGAVKLSPRRQQTLRAEGGLDSYRQKEHTIHFHTRMNVPKYTQNVAHELDLEVSHTRTRTHACAKTVAKRRNRWGGILRNALDRLPSRYAELCSASCSGGGTTVCTFSTSGCRAACQTMDASGAT